MFIYRKVYILFSISLKGRRNIYSDFLSCRIVPNDLFPGKSDRIRLRTVVHPMWCSCSKSWKTTPIVITETTPICLHPDAAYTPSAHLDAVAQFRIWSSEFTEIRTALWTTCWNSHYFYFYNFVSTSTLFGFALPIRMYIASKYIFSLLLHWLYVLTVFTFLGTGFFEF